MSKPPKNDDEDLKMFLDAIKNISDSAIQSAKARESVSEGPKSKSKNDYLYEIDLHGLTVKEARDFLSKKLHEIANKHAGKLIKIRIITGKGRHSGPEGSSLSHMAHSFVQEILGNKIIAITEAPSQVKINNLPIRGHFDLMFRG